MSVPPIPADDGLNALTGRWVGVKAFLRVKLADGRETLVAQFRALPIVVAAVLGLTLALVVGSIGLVVIRPPAATSEAELAVAVERTRLVVWTARALHSGLVVGVTVLWAAVTWWLFKIMILLVTGLYMLLYDISPQYLEIEPRQERFWKQKLNVQLQLVTVLFIGTCTLVLVGSYESAFLSDDVPALAQAFGVMALMAVPLAYAVPWINYWRAWRSVRPRRRFRYFLFSRDAMRSHFASMLSILAFFPIMVWIALERLFAFFGSSAEWLAIRAHVMIQRFAAGDMGTIVYDGSGAASSDSLVTTINVLQTASNRALTQGVGDTVARWLFLVTVGAGLAGLLVRAIVAAKWSDHYRKAMFSLLAKTGRSFAVTGLVALLVEFGYHLSARNGYIWVTAFGFLLAVMVAHDDDLGLPPVLLAPARAPDTGQAEPRRT